MLALLGRMKTAGAAPYKLLINIKFIFPYSTILNGLYDYFIGLLLKIKLKQIEWDVWKFQFFVCLY